MAPPEPDDAKPKPQRGMMTPDPGAPTSAIGLRALLWGAAGVIGVVELCLAALGS